MPNPLHGDGFAGDGGGLVKCQGHLFPGPGVPDGNEVLLLRFENRCEAGSGHVPDGGGDEVPALDPLVRLGCDELDFAADGEFADPGKRFLAGA